MLVSIVVVMGLAGALAWAMYRRQAPFQGGLPVDASWMEELSVERYRPMLRLLDEAEIRTLRSCAGFTARMEARFRRQRCDIFRQYLAALRADFNCLSMALKTLMAESTQDRPDLASVVVRNRAAFLWALVLIEFRLALYRRGWGTVNVAELVNRFDVMHAALHVLVPAEAGSAA